MLSAPPRPVSFWSEQHDSKSNILVGRMGKQAIEKSAQPMKNIRVMKPYALVRGLWFNPNYAQKGPVKCHTKAINNNLHIDDKSPKLNESHYNQQLQEIKSPGIINTKNADYQNFKNDQLTLLS